MQSTPPRPPYDPELGAILEKLGFTPSITAKDIPRIRTANTLSVEVVNDLPVDHEERSIVGLECNDILLSIFRSKNTKAKESEGRPGRPCVYFIHGGGTFAGNRFFGISNLLRQAVVALDAVCVSVEYRLSPEHPDPAPTEDCYAGLLWTSTHAAELGIDPAQLIVAGTSAGGGIAAGMTLMARDRGLTPPLKGQLLNCPMLDDRVSSISSQQYVGEGKWNRDTNTFAWACYLGERRGGEDVSIYASPARAVNLAGLPPAFIDVGSAEVLRDEAVAYASQLWKDGVQVELHVWAGGFHGFSVQAPNAAISATANETQAAWIRRMLAPQ